MWKKLAIIVASVGAIATGLALFLHEKRVLVLDK